MEIKEFIKVEEEGDFIRVNGQFVVKRKELEEYMEEPIGIAIEDAKKGELVSLKLL